MEEENKIDPSKVTLTKTYSMTLAHVNQIKEMGQFLNVSDAEIMRRAIDTLYASVFPKSAEIAG